MRPRVAGSLDDVPRAGSEGPKGAEGDGLVGVDLLVGGELPDSAQDLASFRGYRILHGTSLLGGRTRVTALAVGVLRPAPVS